MMDGSRDIQGYGGGGGSSGQQGSVESPDNLQSIAYARVLDLWGEGEIRGFVHPTNVLQDIALNGTPVANDDGSLNFKNVKFDSRSGSQSQSFMSGFPDVENETSVGVELKSSTPWTQTITDTQLTAVRVRLSMPSIQKSDTTTGDITGYTVQYAIDLKTDSGEYQQCIASSFTGKSTSKYERAHRIDLPAATTGWTVRVRRLTANANLATVADTTTVESYTEITDGKFRYPNSAYGGLIVDASQFSSIPTRAFYMYGRIVSVPSNYNPTTRVYTGTWDGTFKPAWTNNPAWIFYDLVTNARFGLGEYCPASLVNKWALYTIAQYCDGVVSDGFGGTEPRMTCSVFLQTQAEAYKVMQDLASVFRGIIYWAGGAIQAVADMPGDPVYTYTAANVVDGEFTYQGSGRKTRYTVALVSWNDQTDFGRAKVEYVSDDEGVARYGVQPVEVTAFGCTSRAQAHRVGLWTLYTSRLETGTVTFKVGLDGTLCAPGQIIRVSDPARAGKRQAGRIHSATATAITVDNPPTVAVGDAITCALPTGITETHAVTAVSGNVISVASPGFSIAPQAESVWVVESSTLVAETYRVVSVLDDSSGDEISYTITALQHNASKFNAIDFGDALMVPPVSVVPPSSQVGPASVTLSSNETAGTVLASILLSISWTATANAVRYQCEWRKDNGEWQTLGDHLKGLSADIHNAKPGTYYARVRAFNANGIGSVPTLSDPLVIVDQSKQPTKLTDLKTEVDDAAQQAQIANAELAQIADDSLLSPPEKPTVERDYGVITTEQAGIDAQATAYGITTEKTAYDSAVSALTAYLATLTAPVAWNDKSGYTDIVGATFRSKFAAVYTARQTLLNAIYAKAKSLADTATALASQVAVLNPGFDAGDTGWTKGTGWAIKSDGSFGHGAGYAERVGGADGALRNNAVCFVQPGHSYKVQALIKAIGANGQCYARISWRDLNDSEIGTTNGNLITGTTVAGSYAVGTPPAGAVFAHAEIAATSHTVGTYQVDNVVSTLQPATADEIAETGSKKWAGESGADVTSANTTFGDNVVVNPSGKIGSITPHAVSNATLQAYAHDGSLRPSETPGGSFLITGTLGTGAIVRFNNGIDVDAQPSDIWTGALWLGDWGSGNIGSGWLRVYFMDATGTDLSSANVSFSSISDSDLQRYSIVSPPAPAGTARVQLRLGFNMDGNNTQAIFQRAELRKATVADAGSGVTLGNQFNLPAVTFAGISAMPTSNPISFSISGTTITFSVAAFTMNAGSGGTVSYSASSASRSDQSAGTTRTYYLFYIDHGAKGGSKALQVTAFLSTLAASDDNVFIGTCTVTIASGGGGSSGTGGGGGGVLPPPGSGGYPIP